MQTIVMVSSQDLFSFLKSLAILLYFSTLISKWHRFILLKQWTYVNVFTAFNHVTLRYKIMMVCGLQLRHSYTLQKPQIFTCPIEDGSLTCSYLCTFTLLIKFNTDQTNYIETLKLKFHNLFKKFEPRLII